MKFPRPWRRERHDDPVLARSTWFRIERQTINRTERVVVILTMPAERSLPWMSPGDAEELGEALAAAGRKLLPPTRSLR